MKIAPIAEIKAQFSAFVKASEDGPVVVTKNGKPVAVLLGISDEDEIERLVLAYSKKLRVVLDKAEQRIRENGGLSHDEVWRQVDEVYANASTAREANAEVTNKPRVKRKVPNKKV